MPSHSSSQVVQFLSGSTVFITGGTGFVGKLIIEKLLRSCPDVKRIYVLIRNKKEKGMDSRLQELLDSKIFETLKKQTPNFAEKFVPLLGDACKSDLGLSDSDSNLLIEEVDYVFHCAATVRFNEKLRIAAYINVRSARDLILLAQKMKKLRSLVYISTAYSQCIYKEIKEQFYEPPISGEQLLQLVHAMDDKFLESIVPTLIGKYPNIYTFTKSVAESLVKSFGSDLSIAVIRPSIIMSSSKEPVPGWVDCIYGPTSIGLIYAAGLLRILYCNADCLIDMVPVDFVANCSIAAAVEMGLQKNKQSTKIYNYVSYNQNPITCRGLFTLCSRYALKTPTIKQMWHPFIILISSESLFKICKIFLHHIPAYTIDSLRVALGKQAILIPIYKKIDCLTEVLTYFTTNQWQFENRNPQELFENLNEIDKDLFNFDMGSFSWEEYFKSYVLGIRRYMIKESDDTIEKARKIAFGMKAGHYILVGFMIIALLKLFMMLYRFFF